MEETPIFRMAQSRRRSSSPRLPKCSRRAGRKSSVPRSRGRHLHAVPHANLSSLGAPRPSSRVVATGFSNQSIADADDRRLRIRRVHRDLCVNADKFSRKRVIIISSCCLIAFALFCSCLIRRSSVAQLRHQPAVPVSASPDGYRVRSDRRLPAGTVRRERALPGSGIGKPGCHRAAFVPTIATWLSHHWGVHSWACTSV